MINLEKQPYNLSKEEIYEVYQSLKNMTIEEKIGQIFFVIGPMIEDEFLGNFIRKYKPGGIMYRPDQANLIKNKIVSIQKNSDIPMFTAANLESGGIGIVTEGTFVGNPMQIAATQSEKNAQKLGEISSAEATEVGVNMSFSPIVDIDYNFKNPITNIRTFGSNPETVLAMSRHQIRGLQTNDVIPVIKHFPGDGMDDRDQHLVTSINSLDMEDWKHSYGKIYSSLIKDGAPVVMIGHIAFPEYVKSKSSDKKEAFKPASLSKILVTDLLRKDLGFNGLAITDATPMIGYNAHHTRRDSLIKTINSGIDMILFNKNIDEDYGYVMEAVRNKEISMDTIDSAVIRILATKKAQKIEQKIKTIISDSDVDFENIGNNISQGISKEISDQSITLVRNNENILPISPKKTPRIRLYLLKDSMNGGFKQGEEKIDSIADKLINVGFKVEVFNNKKLDFHEIFEEGVEELKDKFDLAIYIGNIETASNHTTRRIDWISLMAANAPWFVHDIPTIFVSTANPYHLYDVPMVETFINTYSANEETLVSLVEKLIGKSEFKGISPVKVEL